MSRWNDAAQIPWNIGAGTGTPNPRQVSVPARIANWYGTSSGPGSTATWTTRPDWTTTTNRCSSMSSRYEHVKYLPCAWISGSSLLARVNASAHSVAERRGGAVIRWLLPPVTRRALPTRSIRATRPRGRPIPVGHRSIVRSDWFYALYQG